MKNYHPIIYRSKILVSNPWREAIEVGKKLPALTSKPVSNPWREAIEASDKYNSPDGWNVSNPWREAIEVPGRWW